MTMKWLCSVALLTSTGCIGNLTLAPHLNREADLAPAAAAGRYSTVLERAAGFEKQNEASKDVHWYRAWRAAAMVGLGQAAQAEALLDKVLSDISAARVSPAQPERLRLFIYDLKASAALAQGQAARAVGLLDQSLGIAEYLDLESNGDCDQDLMLAARHQQIEDMATAAGIVPRSARAHGQMGQRFEAWVKCKRLEDYPAFSALPTIVAAVQRSGAAGPVIPKTNARLPPAVIAPVPPKRVAPKPAPPPPPAPAAKAPANSPAALAVAGVKYAPVNPAPWQEGLQAIAPLVAKRAPGAQTDMLIRTDGGQHALRIRLARPARNLEALLPVFRTAVVFFERTRGIQPAALKVVVVSGGVSVLADKAAVMQLFLAQVDAVGFISQLTRLP